MPGVNQDAYPGYIDISQYPGQYKVFAKQLERQEELLVEIRDELRMLNMPKKSRKKRN